MKDLTKSNLERVYQLAVKQRGVAGIPFDGMRELPRVRQRIDLPDAVEYRPFWRRPGDERCFGFVLSPRAGENVRLPVSHFKLLPKPGLMTVRIGHSQKSPHMTRSPK